MTPSGPIDLSPAIAAYEQAENKRLSAAAQTTNDQKTADAKQKAADDAKGIVSDDLKAQADLTSAEVDAIKALRDQFDAKIAELTGPPPADAPPVDALVNQ